MGWAMTTGSGLSIGYRIARRLGWLPTPNPSAPRLTSETQARVIRTLALLAPHDTPGLGRRRIGGDGDGGYVLADCLTPDQAVLSLGIGPDLSFDHELAEQGHHIVMLDHTITALPQTHPNFTWLHNGIGPAASDDGVMLPLDTLLDRLPASQAAPILKMDVEGAEWDVLASAAPATLRRFAQITLELHTLLALGEPGFNTTAHAALANLLHDFLPIHVHGNNFGILGQVGGLPCPETLEVTYLRHDLAQFAPSTTWFPTPLDRPNFDELPDHLLWFFPFAPGSAALALASRQASCEF